MTILAIILNLLVIAPAAAALDFSAPPALSGDFRQVKTIKDAGVTLTSSGRFAFDRERGIRWETIRPFASSIVIANGYLCLNRKILEGGPAMDQVAKILHLLLAQDFERLEEYFAVSRTADGVELAAKDEMMAAVFERITVRGGKYVEFVRFSGREGDVTEISFNNVKETAQRIACEN